MKQPWVIFALGLLLNLNSPSLTANELPIERIEPAFWWVGMKHEKLQLMVRGESVATAQPSLNYPGVVLESFTPSDNKNYLFIDLRISADAKPGVMEIAFKLGDKIVKQPYRLLEREKSSAERQSFNNADVILNLMPDRFANGNPTNDRVSGYRDALNRSDDSAGRHGGDIQGIIDHLDYIANMGYTMLWPTPLTESNQAQYSYHGYAATDNYKIDPRYGSNDDYRRMVQLARQKGIGVIWDFVPNHIGSQHWWLRDLPMKDWLTQKGQFVATQHRRTTASDPYAAQSDRDNFTTGWFEPNMPDMNQKNPYVATYQIQNCIWWLEFAGISGVRVDTYGYSHHAFMAQWTQRVREEYPNLKMVGEEWSLNPLTVSYWLDGRQNNNGYRSLLPSVMDFPLNDTLRRALTAKETLHTGFAELYEALANDVIYPQPRNLVLFEGNHDVSRLFSALDEDLDLYKMALAYVATIHRIPQFYYGTEILMTSTKHRDDGAFRRDFPGGWSGDKVNAFSGQGLNAKQLDAQSFVKKLLNWRKSQGVIHNGKLMHYAPENGVYVYFRYDDKQRVMVAFNKNSAAIKLDTKRFDEVLPINAKGREVISGQSMDLSEQITLPARSVQIVEIH
jgi:glycosidase